MCNQRGEQKTKEKSFIPELGEDSNKILKSLGYSKENIRVLKKEYNLIKQFYLIYF